MTDHYPALLAFARDHVTTGDIDPVYPVLAAHVADTDPDTAAWTVIVYVAFYDLAAAVAFLHHHPDPADLDHPDAPTLADRLPKATERRAHRQRGKTWMHLTSVRTHTFGHGPDGWLRTAHVPGDPARSWRQLQVLLQQPYGNGRWAAYKTGELTKVVLGHPVEPTDAGHGWSSGPRKGLALLYPPVNGNTPAAVARLDAQTTDLQRRLADDGLPLPVEQVETVLCDFHSHVHGRYDVGHDIALLGQQLARGRDGGWLPGDLYDRLEGIRRDTFDPALL